MNEEPLTEKELQYGLAQNDRDFQQKTISVLQWEFRRRAYSQALSALQFSERLYHCNICGGKVDLKDASAPTIPWAGGRGKRRTSAKEQ